MINIEKHVLRSIAAAAKSAPSWYAVGEFGDVVEPAKPEWKPVHEFCKTFTVERVLALLDELEAKDKRIAVLEAIKPIGYFAYDNDGGFTNHETAARAQEEAQNAIEYFRENACDGWSDEVDSVCWGAIMQEANKVDERPVTEEDKCASHIECYCDYALLPASNSTAGTAKGE